MRIRTRSLVIMISGGLTQVTRIALGIVLVRLISQELFGTYRQVFLVESLLLGLISLEIGKSLYYFLPKLGEEKRRTLLTQSFSLSILQALLVFGLIYFGAGQIAAWLGNPGLEAPLRVFSLYPFIDVTIRLVPAYMISLDRAIRASVFSGALALVRIGVVCSTFAYGWDLVAVLKLVLVTEGLIALIGCADMIRLAPTGTWGFDLRLLAEQWRFTWPLWLTAVVGIMNVWLDKLLISIYFDPATYAVYQVGAIELPIVSLVTVSVGTAMMPNLVQLADRGKPLDALAIWQEGARKCSLILFPCFALFMVIGPDLMVFLYQPSYARAAWPFAVYLLMLPLRIVIYGNLLRAVGQTRPIAIAAIIAMLMNLALSTGLMVLGRGSLLSFVGPAVGATAAQLISGIYLFNRIGRIFETPVSRILRWRELGGLLLLTLICGAAAWLIPLPKDPLGVMILVRCACFVLLLGVAVLVTGALRRDERQLITGAIRRGLRLFGRG